MRALEFIRDHVTFKLPYDFSYHMKTPFMLCEIKFVINRPSITKICNEPGIRYIGGFHVVAKIIREFESHMIPYKFKCSHWWKIIL